MRRPSPQMREFARLYAIGPPELRGNATECYYHVYKCTRQAARRAGSRLLSRDDIRGLIEAYEAVRDADIEAALESWKDAADMARRVLVGLLTDPGTRDATRAAIGRDFLDRHEGKPRQAMDITASAADQWIKELSEELAAIDDRIEVERDNGNGTGVVGPVSPSATKSKPRTTAAAEAQAQREASRAAEHERRRASRREDSERERRDRMRDETRKLLKQTMGDG